MKPEEKLLFAMRMPTTIGNAEDADLIACNREEVPAKPHFAKTNIHTVCAECGHKIYHRPNLPKEVKKVCRECAAKLATAHTKRTGEEVEVTTSKDQVAEVLDYLKRVKKLN